MKEVAGFETNRAMKTSILYALTEPSHDIGSLLVSDFVSVENDGDRHLASRRFHVIRLVAKKHMF